MKENYVNRLRIFLESEVTEAEILMNAKKISTQVQEMIEKIGRIQNESLPPLVDQMREVFGEDTTARFKEDTDGALLDIMSALNQGKDSVIHNVRQIAIAGGLDLAAHGFGPGAGSDFEQDMGADMGMGADMDMGTDDGMGMDGDLGGELDGIGDELDAAGDMAPLPPNNILGRTKKESIENLAGRISCLQESLRKIKEKTGK